MRRRTSAGLSADSATEPWGGRALVSSSMVRGPELLRAATWHPSTSARASTSPSAERERDALIDIDDDRERKPDASGPREEADDASSVAERRRRNRNRTATAPGPRTVPALTPGTEHAESWAECSQQCDSHCERIVASARVVDSSCICCWSHEGLFYFILHRGTTMPCLNFLIIIIIHISIWIIEARLILLLFAGLWIQMLAELPSFNLTESFFNCQLR